MLFFVVVFLLATEAWIFLHYLYSTYYSTMRSAAPQTTLWGGPGPRFEPGTGDLRDRDTNH